MATRIISLVYANEDVSKLAGEFQAELHHQIETSPHLIICRSLHSQNNFSFNETGLDSINTLLEDRYRLAVNHGIAAENLYWVFLITPDMVTKPAHYHASHAFLTIIGYIYAYHCQKYYPQGNPPKRFYFLYPKFSSEYTFSPEDKIFFGNGIRRCFYSCTSPGQSSVSGDFTDAVLALINDINKDINQTLEITPKSLPDDPTTQHLTQLISNIAPGTLELLWKLYEPVTSTSQKEAIIAPIPAQTPILLPDDPTIHPPTQPSSNFAPVFFELLWKIYETVTNVSRKEAIKAFINKIFRDNIIP